jgi:subtilase family serine protease
VIQPKVAVSLQPASSTRSTTQWLCFVIFTALTLATCVRPALAADSKFIAQNTPAFVSTSNIVRTEDPSKTMEVSIWLNPHNRAELDTLASDLYDPKSPQYRHWLKSSDIAARFAPTAAEAKTVQTFLESQNLKVVSVGPNNFYVRASGTAADVEHAFHVQLNYYQAGTKTLRANASDPYIEGPAAALVQAVSGLDDAQFEHPLDLRPSGPASTAPTGPTALAQAAIAPDSDTFQTVCFPGPKTESYTTEGTYPKATYAGNGYNTGTAGCVYSPSNLYEAYNLKGLYAKGFKGTGQTIVILDWCGSPTVLEDANAFSKKYGLPKLTSANFSILNVPTPSQCSAPDLEINLDVEWAHAVAPGAAIDLVVPPTNYLEDIDEAWFYAVNYGLGNVISGSFGSFENADSGAELIKENLIAEIGAVSGIASNFSSGDGGSLGQIGGTVSVPANLPYATGVGGVSLALNADNSIAFQTGWSTYLSTLISGGVIDDPPQANGSNQYVGGSGGGPSAFFSKPSFQKKVPGKFRQVPDISWLADPYTAVAVLISEPGQLPEQIWTGVGGTSVACPMFSALWAIANEEAGTALGQAAPYLYSMPAATITDIVPYTSKHDVTAVIQESSSVTHSYNAADTLQVQEPLFGSFYSVIFDVPLNQDTALTVSFGQDYWLKTAVGWDDMTGLGTPNAEAFADYFAPQSASKK